MKYKITLLIAILLQTILFAQNTHNSTIIAHYSYRTQWSPAFIYNIDSSLTFNDSYSLYEMDHTNSFNENYQEDGNTVILGIKAKENDFVFKDFENSAMYFTDTASSIQPLFIKDSLQLMEWTLTDKYKEILGYHCQEATALYGGRFYIAYFTAEMPVSNGPWRFHGLPGLILEVGTLDGVFKLGATSLEIKNESTEIVNPYKDKELMSWEEFLALYRKKYDEVIRNSMQDWGPSQTIPKKRIVEYIKD